MDNKAVNEKADVNDNDDTKITNVTNEKKVSAAAKKRNRQKNKNAAQNLSKTGTANIPNATAGSDSVASTSNGSSNETKETQNVMDLMEQLKLNHRFLPLLRSAAKTSEEAMTKTYKFWSTQPVPKLDEKIQVNEPIEEAKDISEYRAKPYALPDGFEWVALNIEDFNNLIELYTLLNENYVEDDDAMFRFDYQPKFLKWALQPPGWRMDWHIGVRVVKSGLLVGFISAIPGNIKIYDKTEKIVEINFLCVHKKLRSKRVAPVLIREITRRVNLTGIFQAVYTAGIVLPKPVSTCRYWHRSLNPRKLIDVN